MSEWVHIQHFHWEKAKFMLWHVNGKQEASDKWSRHMREVTDWDQPRGVLHQEQCSLFLTVFYKAHAIHLSLRLMNLSFDREPGSVNV